MANPNPSPATRFKKGNVANPGGKTKKQKKAEMRAAANAAILREKMISAMMEKVEAGEDVLELMDANALKLFKDSEDRAHGTPKAFTETKHDVADPMKELIGYVAEKGSRLGS